MILGFEVENFRALAAPAVLDLTRRSLRTTVPRGGASWTDHVEPVAVIYGPNASGKSTVLEALMTLARAMRGSGSLHAPSAIAPGYRDLPTRYQVEFTADGIRYEYTVWAAAWGIQYEELAAWPRGTRRLLFRRTQDAADETPAVEKGSSLTGPTSEVSRLVRPQMLFLATALRYGHPALAPVAHALLLSGGIEGVNVAGRQDWGVLRRVIVEMVADRSQADLIRALLHAADLGLDQVEIVEHELPPEAREQARRIVQAFNDGEEFEDNELPRFAEALVFRHHGAHGGYFDLGIEYQSQGTISWLITVWHALNALREGSVLLLDELDASLHPALTRYVIELFLDPRLNVHGAQLIATTHDVTLLGNSPVKLLEDRQVWFLEKNESGASELFCLDDFDNRRGNNIERRYLAGAFGGVPRIDESALIAFLVGATDPAAKTRASA